MKKKLLTVVLGLSLSMFAQNGGQFSGGGSSKNPTFTTAKVTSSAVIGPGLPADSTANAVGLPTVWDSTNHRVTVAPAAVRFAQPIVKVVANTTDGTGYRTDGLPGCGGGGVNGSSPNCVYLVTSPVVINIASGTEGNAVVVNASGVFADGGALPNAMSSGLVVGQLTSAVAAGQANMIPLVGFNLASGTGNMATNSPNTMGASGTIDGRSMSATAGFALPKAAGAAPTTQAFCAWDSTNNRLVCGDGTGTIAFGAAFAFQNVTTGTTSLSTMSGLQNKTKAWGFFLNHPIVTSAFCVYVGTADNSANAYGFGILDASGNRTAHIDNQAGNGTFLGGVNGGRCASWAAAVYLPPGKYYFALTTSAASPTLALGGSTAGIAQFASFVSPTAEVSTTNATLNASQTLPADSWVYGQVVNFNLH